MADERNEQLERELEKARERFSPYWYILKDQYQERVFVAAYMISAGGRIGYVPSRTDIVPMLKNVQ